MSQQTLIKRQAAAYSYPLRSVLVVLGIYSGKHDNKVLSTASSCYHLFTCFLHTALAIAGKLSLNIPDLWNVKDIKLKSWQQF